MATTKIGIIIAREFNERVRKKSFILTTILMPVLMIGLMVAPTLIMRYSKGETRHISVIDRSDIIAPKLESGEEVIFEETDLDLEEARRDRTDLFGILWIGEDVMTNPSNVKLYTNGSSSIIVEESISGQIADIIEKEKLRAYDIDNLAQILEEVDTKVYMQVFRNDQTSGEGDDKQANSSVVATAAGFVLAMILYMFLLIYGSMVMQSVIEEKNNRVLEVVVSSVSPFQLMLGKILGIASVAVVQVLIWGVLICGVGAFVMPQLIPADMMGSVEAMQAGTLDPAVAGGDIEMVQMLATATDFGFVLQLFVYLLLYVVGGYLLYSAMFAAVGSAVDSVQDAQQLQTPITIPIILSIFVMMAVMKDPNSPLVFWFSLIPFTSPVVMMARIPCGIPTWEIVLSLVLLYITFVAMVWLAAKIYRVGIFMYGKKPTFKELYKWVRYKY
ncbi:MAG: ABC transporter permease [Alistipes sp.]|nr:ABC transporter permease [Alistipes sp.]